MAAQYHPHHILLMKNLPLTGDEEAALVRRLHNAIDPLSSQPVLLTLKAILNKLRPEPTRMTLAPEPRIYAPPRASAARRRR
jgi:hypothetical protein